MTSDDQEMGTSGKRRLTVPLTEEHLATLERLAARRDESELALPRSATSQLRDFVRGLSLGAAREADFASPRASGTRGIAEVDHIPLAETHLDDRYLQSAARRNGRQDDYALSATELIVGLVDTSGEPLTKDDAARKQLLTDVHSVSEELMREVSRDFSRVHTLSGAKFEELVAELLYRQGYTVNRVPPGPDGGVDIYAAQKTNLGQFLYLVQCKRWRPSKPVGIDVVQRLYGRVKADRATAGVVVTTSRFTKPAREFAVKSSRRLSLRDYSDLVEWLVGWGATSPKP